MKNVPFPRRPCEKIVVPIPPAKLLLLLLALAVKYMGCVMRAASR